MIFEDNVSDKFEFQVGGKDFDLKYPSLSEMEPMQKKLDEVAKSKDSEEVKNLKINNIIIEGIREFITPVGHEESLEDVLQTVPITVARKLNRKLVSEIFGEE